MTDETYLDALASWRAARLAALKADDGWLNLTDRVWVEEGSHTVGAAPGNDIVLSVGPARLGTVLLRDGKVEFGDAEGREIVFAPVPDNPPRAVIGRLLVELTEIEGRHAIRVRDLDAPGRAEFDGLSYFPVAPDWRICADWVALDQPVRYEVDTVKGIPTFVTIGHKTVFQHDGRRIELLPTHWKGGKPMFVIRDQTARDATYPAARFLIGEDLDGAHVTLDFNKAFSPPCAFTDHAVCPLPPRENVLPFRIEAGEKRPDLSGLPAHS